PIHARIRDMVCVRRKTVTYHLSIHSRTSSLSRFITFKNHSGCTTTWHQAISILVEGPGSRDRIVLSHRKCAQRIKVTHGIHIRFLRASAYNAVLHSLPDHQVTHSDGMGTAGTSGTNGKVDTF